MTRTTLRYALHYASLGWPVFPCRPGEKAPATRHGYLDATTDSRQITEWFGRHPDWNLAVATAPPDLTSSMSTCAARQATASPPSPGCAPPDC
jgi:hypothetical protein